MKQTPVCQKRSVGIYYLLLNICTHDFCHRSAAEILTVVSKRTPNGGIPTQKWFWDNIMSLIIWLVVNMTLRSQAHCMCSSSWTRASFVWGNWWYYNRHAAEVAKLSPENKRTSNCCNHPYKLRTDQKRKKRKGKNEEDTVTLKLLPLPH